LPAHAITLRIAALPSEIESNTLRGETASTVPLVFWEVDCRQEGERLSPVVPMHRVIPVVWLA
jgi:hypothetical protein